MNRAMRIMYAAMVGILFCPGFSIAQGSEAPASIGIDEDRCLQEPVGVVLQLDAPSPKETYVASSVMMSGSLFDSVAPLSGETVVVTVVAPEGEPQSKELVTDSNGGFACDCVPTLAGTWSIEAHYGGSTAHSPANAQPESFFVTAADTFLTARFSAMSIVAGTSLSMNGALRAQAVLDPTAEILASQKVTLVIYDPSTDLFDSRTEITTKSGRYHFADILLPSAGNWDLQLQFDGDDNLNPCMTEVFTVKARPSAGYAILVAGKVPGGSGLDSHNKTTDRAYLKFKSRGFKDEDIFYFRYGTPSDAGIVVDEEPGQEPGGNGLLGIREAIVTWAGEKMRASNGPLYIVFVNHGNPEKFYVDPDAAEFQDRIIDPYELESWISQLEDSLTEEAAEEGIIFIYGGCYSGSFIPVLSQEGKKRILITSADPNEQSFKGPMEEDGVRDGEFFVSELFAVLGQGWNLKQGFETATAVIEAYTSNLSGNGGASDASYADDAAQHPLLDDNGDGEGSNDALSTHSGNDGSVSAQIILGFDYATNSGVGFASVSPAMHLAPSDADPVLEATIDNTEIASDIWVVIKSPGFDLGASVEGQSEQREVTAPRLNFDSQPVAGTYMLYNFEKGDFSGFTAPGRYEILYFVKDTSGCISVLKRSFVYRSVDGTDAPPEPFQLLAPEVGSLESTTLLLDWEDSVDPEKERVSYRVEISTDASFGDPEFVIEGIDGSGKMIDESVGLNDLTLYFWRVIAMDVNGNQTVSSQTGSFTTNDTNGWGNYNVLTAMVRNLNDPATWPPGSSIEIQPYIGTVYNHYYSSLVPLGPYAVDSEAPQFSHEHDDVEVIEESPTSVVQLSEPDAATVVGKVMDSTTVAPLHGATVVLEAISGIYAGTQFSVCSEENGAFQIENLYGAVDYEVTAQKNFYTPFQDTLSLQAGEFRDLGSIEIGFDDVDEDELPDEFEQVIVDADSGDDISTVWDVFGTDDFDQDQRTNGEECLASTDPTSADSYLKIVQVFAEPIGEATITWTSECGVYYEIYYTDDLVSWSCAAGPIAWSGTGSTCWTDDGECIAPPPAGATKRYYRVAVY